MEGMLSKTSKPINKRFAKNPKLLLKVLLDGSNELVQLNTVEILYNVLEIFMEDGGN